MQMNPIAGTRSVWPAWAEFLRQRGLENIAIFFLEAAGPFAILGAQALYLGGPLINSALTGVQRDSLAELLENRQAALDFAAFLREEKIQ